MALTAAVTEALAVLTSPRVRTSTDNSPAASKTGREVHARGVHSVHEQAIDDVLGDANHTHAGVRRPSIGSSPAGWHEVERLSDRIEAWPQRASGRLAHEYDGCALVGLESRERPALNHANVEQGKVLWRDDHEAGGLLGPRLRGDHANRLQGAAQRRTPGRRDALDRRICCETDREPPNEATARDARPVTRS
jgi:hypothetical protein